MKRIDIKNWDRKEHFEFFKGFDYPFFDICFEIETTKIYNYCKKNNFNFFKTCIYLITKTTNEISEFKQRIEDNGVIEYDIIHPSFTDILNNKNLFTYCTVDYDEDIRTFFHNIDKKRKKNKGVFGLNLEDEKGRSDLLFLTCIPWINFNFLQNPIMSYKTNNSIPIISWGKYKKNQNRIFMPISVHAHHSLLDGYHIKLFKENFENQL